MPSHLFVHIAHTHYGKKWWCDCSTSSPSRSQFLLYGTGTKTQYIYSFMHCICKQHKGQRNTSHRNVNGCTPSQWPFNSIGIPVIKIRPSYLYDGFLYPEGAFHVETGQGNMRRRILRLISSFAKFPPSDQTYAKVKQTEICAVAWINFNSNMDN